MNHAKNEHVEATYHVSFMSARTDCGVGQRDPSWHLAVLKIFKISPLDVVLGMSRRIIVFCSILTTAASFTTSPLIIKPCMYVKFRQSSQNNHISYFTLWLFSACLITASSVDTALTDGACSGNWWDVSSDRFDRCFWIPSVALHKPV